MSNISKLIKKTPEQCLVLLLLTLNIFCTLGHSMSNAPEFQRLGHDPSQILMKLFQIKGIYEIRLS